MIDAHSITKALGGRWCGGYGLVRCPTHDDREPSLSVRDGKNDLIVNCFAGCDWQNVKAEFRRQGLLDEHPGAGDRHGNRRHHDHDEDLERRQAASFQFWGETISLNGTLGWRYFTEHRKLDLAKLDLGHVLRWHDGIGAVVALMTAAGTNEPTGIHRTFLNPDGTKRERKMLGRQGIIRLSADEDVTMGLGLTEGIEDGLAVLLSGWAPVWAATSAGAIERFPVLSGIEALTIFADADGAGMRAACACAETWIEAGREAMISPPPERGRP